VQPFRGSGAQGATLHPIHSPLLTSPLVSANNVLAMSALPPSETPALRTFHLQEGEIIAHPSLQKDSSHGKFSLARFRFPSSLPISKGAIIGLAFLILPIGAAFALQPQTPKLSAAQKTEAEQLLAQQKNENENLVANLDPTTSNSEDTDASLTEAELAGAGDGENNSFNYYLTLSKGFLNKAIELSRSTAAAGTQSEEQKTEILANLEKALDNVNTAIDLDSRQGSAFLLRARIYKTASVIRPELAEKSEQDLQIARALGVDTAALDSSDPLDYVPTQQADNGNGAIVADAEEGSDSTVGSETNSNAQTGQAILQPGSDSVYVALPGLTSTMQLSVSPAGGTANAQGLTYTIQSRKEGKGFTIQSSAPVEQNVTLDWTASDLVE